MDTVLLLTFLVLPVLATFAYASIRGAPWVPMWHRDIGRFLNVAQLKSGELFYDLGCGDGRLVIAAARAGAVAIGFECSILPYVLARTRCVLSKKIPGIFFVRYRDFWSADLSDADVVYCFLMPKVYPKLKEKFELECRPGTRVILYVWPMPGWEVDTRDDVPGQPKLYRHVVP